MSIVMSHAATLSVCPRCKGLGRGYIDVDGGKTCITCGGDKWIDLTGLRRLATNLAVAGALCAAFSQGAVYIVRSVLRPNEPEAFTPGCGRSAP
jgi:hypothetical protein